MESCNDVTGTADGSAFNEARSAKDESLASGQSELVGSPIDDVSQMGETTSIAVQDFVRRDVLVDPLSLLRGVLECGVDPNDAAKMIQTYYEACQVASCSSIASMSTRSDSAPTGKQLRFDRWQNQASSLPLVPGQCYLHVIRWARRLAFAKRLGPNPLWADFVHALEPGDIDERVAEKFKLYRWPESGYKDLSGIRYHVAETCVGAECLGTVAQAINIMIRSYDGLNKEFEFSYPVQLIDRLPMLGTVGADNIADVSELPRSEDLDALMQLDFTECRCQIHKPPRTLDPSFSREGCCKRKCGQARVVFNAFSGVSHACTADEMTRRADKRFLEFLLSGDDPGILEGRGRVRDFALLCTSSKDTTIEAFGNGYCYLSLMSHDTWWRVARLLGPNPRVTSVLWAMKWAGRYQSRAYRLTEVKLGYFHVTPDKSIKGVHQGVGAQLFREMLLIARDRPDVRIGLTVGKLAGGNDELVARDLVQECQSNAVPLVAMGVTCLSMLVTIICLLVRLWCTRDKKAKTQNNRQLYTNQRWY